MKRGILLAIWIVLSVRTQSNALAEQFSSSSPLSTPESVVVADITAQSSGDWDTYLNLRSNLPGAPENASNYEALWQQGETGIRGNVVSARLESIKLIPFDFARSLIGACCYIDNLTNPQAFYVIVDYKLRTEDKYACDGPNARLYILDHGDNGWKIIQVSEPPITAFVNNGLGIGSYAEQELLGRQQVRTQTGQFVNSHGQVIFSTAPASAMAHQFPTSITVAHSTTFNSNPSCQYQYLIGCVDFITYVKNVLPNEWAPPSSFASEALKAGAITAKMVGWYRVYNAKYPNQGYDVKDQDCDQVYRANSAVTSTNNAVDAVAGVGFDRADGTLFYASYSAGSYDGSGYHGGRMYQNGTNYLANNGYSYANAYMDMVHYYYDSSSATGNQLAHFFTYTEGGTGCGGGVSVTVTSPNGGDVWASGSTHTITWNGNGSSSNMSYYKIALSTDGGVTFPNDLTPSGIFDPSARSFSWSISSSLNTTQARIRVRALDANGNILAFDASDADFTIGSTQPADLTLQSITATHGTFHPGDSLFIPSFTIANIGGSTSPNYTVSFYLSIDTTITSSDTYLGTTTPALPGLAAGASASYNTTVFIPNNLGTGNYYLGAIVDLTDSNASNNANYDSTPITVISNYTITTSSSPSAGGTTTGDGTFAAGSSRTVTATASSGYSFVSWTESGSVVSSSASYTFTLNSNRTLMANFTSVNYTITTSSSPSAGGTTTGDGTFAAGSSRTVAATANSGYSFVNWTESGSVVSSSASYTFTLNSNRSLVANFTSVNYTITTSSSPAAGGTTTGSGTFAAGSSRTVTATANSGYSFVNWTENGSVASTSASYTFTLNSSRTLVANFTSVNYTITTSSSPSAGGTTTGDGTFAAGSSRTVTATASSGYSFVSWTESGSVVSSSASYTFTLNSNRTLVANFTSVNYTITTSSSPSAGGTTTGDGTFPAGSSRTVTATANNGYSFVNWTESGSIVSSSASYTFTLNSNRSLVATFTATPLSSLEVTNLNSQGAGSLLDALNLANSTPSLKTITFNLPGSGPWTITTSTTLLITAPVVIDGTSQPGYDGGFNRVYVEGTSGISNVFALAGHGGTTIKGLGIYNYDNDGVAIGSSASWNFVDDCYIGFKSTATGILRNVSRAPSCTGVEITGSYNKVRRTTISGVYNGINIGEPIEQPTGLVSHDNLFEYNRIGTDPLGQTTSGYENTSTGILLRAGVQSSWIGGYNVIAGNGGSAVEIVHPSSFGNRVYYNYLGVNDGGTKVIDGRTNDQAILIGNVARNNGAWGNVVAGNRKAGIVVNSGDGNWIWNNTIGLNQSQTVALGGQPSGIVLNVDAAHSPGVSPVRNSIQGNMICNQSLNGIEIYNGVGNGIYNNWIGTNSAGQPFTNVNWGVYLQDSSYNTGSGNAWGPNGLGRVGQSGGTGNSIF
jgi:hypothetical protein